MNSGMPPGDSSKQSLRRFFWELLLKFRSETSSEDYSINGDSSTNAFCRLLQISLWILFCGLLKEVLQKNF